MLELAVTKFGEECPDDEELLCLYVSNIGGGALAAYQGQLLPSKAEPQTLTSYPRWSEPAGALCTRLLQATLKSDPSALRSCYVDQFSILVRIVPHGRALPRVLERIDVSRIPEGWSVTYNQVTRCFPAGRAAGMGAVTLHVLKHVYWGGTRVRKARPHSPRVYRQGKTSYVRISELPEPARTAFERNMSRSGRPCVAGAPDAVFAWDWEDFVAGGR